MDSLEHINFSCFNEIAFSDKIGSLKNERIVHPAGRDYQSIDAVCETSETPLSYKQLTEQNRTNITRNINTAYSSIKNNNAKSGTTWKNNINFEQWEGIELHIEYPFSDVDSKWLNETMWPAFAKKADRLFKNDGTIKDVYIHLLDGTIVKMDMSVLKF